jgi:homoserine kinase
MVSVQVPATSANLGPGFDCLGVALTLYMRCVFEERDEGLLIEGCPVEYANEGNLVYRAWQAAMASLALPVKGLRLVIDSDIPPSRGLGSSAAAIVAGIAGAYALHGYQLDREAILGLAASIEGHPDNVAAAVYGGLSASMREGERYDCVACPLSHNLRFTALVPDFELSTQKARAALPMEVSRQDAVYNISHSLVLLEAFKLGDMALVRRAMRDRLHQPHRLPLIPGAKRLWDLAFDLGAAVCVSGAGPTLMCVHDQKDFAPKLRTVLPTGWQALDLQVDTQGLAILWQ